MLPCPRPMLVLWPRRTWFGSCKIARRCRSRRLSPNDLAFPCQPSMHSRPSVTATRLEFKKVRPLPLQIAEENQSICASCLLRGRNVFRRPIVPLLQDEPFGLTPFHPRPRICASHYSPRPLRRGVGHQLHQHQQATSSGNHLRGPIFTSRFASACSNIIRNRAQESQRCPSSSCSVEICVAPFLAVVFGEPSLDRVVLGAAPTGGDRDALDMLDPALDVVALWSLRDHRKEPAKTQIPAGAILDVDQAAIADGAAATRGDGEPLELCGNGVLERLR